MTVPTEPAAPTALEDVPVVEIASGTAVGDGNHVVARFSHHRGRVSARNQ